MHFRKVLPDMFVFIYQWMFSADTFVRGPADEVVWDGQWEAPLLVPLFILVMHSKS